MEQGARIARMGSGGRSGGAGPRESTHRGIHDLGIHDLAAAFLEGVFATDAR